MGYQWSTRPVEITILAWKFFCSVIFWTVGTDGRTDVQTTRAKIVITTSRDYGSALWISIWNFWKLADKRNDLPPLTVMGDLYPELSWEELAQVTREQYLKDKANKALEELSRETALDDFTESRQRSRDEMNEAERNISNSIRERKEELQDVLTGFLEEERSKREAKVNFTIICICRKKYY